MQIPTNVAKLNSATAAEPSKLYRLAFVGGPFDGHEAQTDVLPDTYFQLQSGPTGCSTKAGPEVTPRVARYKLASVRLVIVWHAPIALCRFEYCGTEMASPSRRSSWWRCRVDNFWRWVEAWRSNCTGHDSRRRSVHVQD